MQLRFMENKVYQVFDGIVKHLTAYGAYVELTPYGIEGFLPMENMRDDDYRFDANTYLVLNRSMDHHDVGRGRGGVAAALSRVEAATTIVGIEYCISAKTLARVPEIQLW